MLLDARRVDHHLSPRATDPQKPKPSSAERPAMREAVATLQDG
jgi:hypothetical protein